MHVTCPAALISLCAPANMSPTAKTRSKMLFNDILKAHEAIEMSDTHYVHRNTRLTDNLRRLLQLW